MLYFQGTVNGRTVRRAIGDAENVRLEEARRAVGRLRYDRSAAGALAPNWTVELRSGDTASSVKLRQRKRLPTAGLCLGRPAAGRIRAVGRDVQLMMIGPAWALSRLYRRFGIPY